jgi:hypothetical protein
MYLGTFIGNAVSKLVGSYWLRKYSNDGGMGLLPSIEVPAQVSPRKVHAHNDDFMDMYSYAFTRQSSPATDA